MQGSFDTHCRQVLELDNQSTGEHHWLIHCFNRKSTPYIENLSMLASKANLLCRPEKIIFLKAIPITSSIKFWASLQCVQHCKWLHLIQHLRCNCYLCWDLSFNFQDEWMDSVVNKTNLFLLNIKLMINWIISENPSQSEVQSILFNVEHASSINKS